MEQDKHTLWPLFFRLSTRVLSFSRAIYSFYSFLSDIVCMYFELWFEFVHVYNRTYTTVSERFVNNIDMFVTKLTQLCPPFKKSWECFVHPVKNKLEGFCPGGVLSVSLLYLFIYWINLYLIKSKGFIHISVYCWPLLQRPHCSSYSLYCQGFLNNF